MFPMVSQVLVTSAALPLQGVPEVWAGVEVPLDSQTHSALLAKVSVGDRFSTHTVVKLATTAGIQA